jgi:diguanylate cyclase (GGDEF)-like protein
MMHRNRQWWSRQTLVALWGGEHQVYRAQDTDAAAIRARLMQSVGLLTPLLMFGNVAGGALVATVLDGAVPAWQWMPWLTALVIVCGAAMANWWEHQQRPRSAVSPRVVVRTVRGAVVIALLWGGATAVWLPGLAHDGQLLLATLVVGMMCGGAFALAAVPQAASSYVAVMMAGSLIGLARSGGLANATLVVMLLVYGALLWLCVRVNARVYTARLVSERDAERQREWMGLLLRDFEEHSADLLWEVGADGRFTWVSPRLASALSAAAEPAHAGGLLEALARHAPPGLPGEHLGDLASALAERRPFRDLTVPVQTAAGARWWSFTAKPLSGDSGQPLGWRGVIADVTVAREARERLEQLAHFDPLTGLANRLQLRQRTPLAAGRRSALVCLDIDRFKSINDTLGHAVGDAVLVEVGRRLRAGLRTGDLAARLGGNEFALVVDPVQDDEQIHALAGRLVHALGQPIEVRGHVVPLSVSVGVAVAPEHGSGLDELHAHADLALQAAKESGRGRYEFFSPRLGDRHRRRVLIAQELRGALARGELALAWQPQVHIEDWRIVGAEVLLRWRHPQLGTVSPAEFVAIAEESGQINEIGRWVLEQACAGAARLPAAISVSVNASPVQLMREDFVATVSLALARSGLPAQRLKVEITESLFMDAVPVALANLHGLRDLGVRIALDDFGTGFSSLAYLLRFPFDLLKIDRAFVLELMGRDDARALVRAIVEMARTLGMGTIAEGVEDSAQLQLLRLAGCEAVQGFLVARPMPLAQLQRLLADWCYEPTATAHGALRTLSTPTINTEVHPQSDPVPLLAEDSP